VPPNAATVIFRVAQEALANVARHARASRVSVALASRDAQLELVIRDNGAGFDVNGPRRGMGLANMRSRAAETGGRVDLASAPGETVVTLTIPLVDVTFARYRQEAVRRAITTVLWLAVFCAIAYSQGLSAMTLVAVLVSSVAIGRNVYVFFRTGASVRA
jgi:signal transduction histidine kinase